MPVHITTPCLTNQIAAGNGATLSLSPLLPHLGPPTPHPHPTLFTWLTLASSKSPPSKNLLDALSVISQTPWEDRGWGRRGPSSNICLAVSLPGQNYFIPYSTGPRTVPSLFKIVNIRWMNESDSHMLSCGVFSENPHSPLPHKVTN